MQSKKMFLSIMILIILTSFPFINAVGASSELWSQTSGGTGSEAAYALVETSDGGFALAGYTDSFGAGSRDFWLVKTDHQGIPEFPSWILMPLLLAATLAVIIYRKRLPEKSSN